MTNAEKYKEQIWEFICKYGETPALDEQEQFVECRSIQCGGCIYCKLGSIEHCSDRFKEWLQEEYNEPEIDWSKVAVDTPILVSDNGTQWCHSHFAEYVHGKVYAWGRGLTSWSSAAQDIIYWRYAKLAEDTE